MSIGTFIRRTQLLEADGKKDNKQKVIAIIIYYRSVAKYGVILKRGGVHTRSTPVESLPPKSAPDM